MVDVTRRPLNPIRRYRIRRLADELDRIVRDRRAHLIAELGPADIHVICMALGDRARLYAGHPAGARAAEIHAKLCEAPR